MKLSESARDIAAVLVTVATAQEGERIAEALVTERVAACVNVLGPLRSVYRWEGAMQRDEEYLLLIKTRREALARLADRIGELHSYEVPEMIVLPVCAGSEAYLNWLRASVD